MNSKLKNKTIVVFGALGFLGKYLSEALAERECNLVLTDLDAEKCLAFGNQLQKKVDSPITALQGDITNENSLVNLLDKIKKEYGHVDAILNCSTYSSGNSLKISAPFEGYELSEWKKMLSVNLDGSFLISKIFGTDMAAEKKGGSIILMSSIYGFLGTDQEIYESVNTNKQRFNNPASYSASKGGVISLAKYLATYWADKNIRVNVLSLGGIYNDQDIKFVEEYSKRVPMKRMGNLSEIVSAVLFLLSDESSYYTGQNLIVDGGLSAW